MDENPHFRRTFRDVIRGFSEVSVLEETVYIKHLSAHDQVDVDLIYDKHLNLAKKRGIQTEKETLSQLLETGDWSEDKDDEIGDTFVTPNFSVMSNFKKKSPYFNMFRTQGHILNSIFNTS